MNVNNSKAKTLVESYLDRYGWHYRKIADDQWLTGWRGEKRSYPLKIEQDESWLTLKVSPFIANPEHLEFSKKLANFLLELNDEIQLAKLAIDASGHIVLVGQIFSINLNYDEFSTALGILGYYTERLYEDILEQISQASSLSPLTSSMRFIS